MKVISFFVLVVICLIVYTYGAADTVYLLDGTSVSGAIKDETAEEVVVEKDGNMVSIKSMDIDYIQEGDDEEELEEVVEPESDEKVSEARGIEQDSLESKDNIVEIPEVEEQLEEEDAIVEKESEENEDAIIIKPKISGSGKYTTY